MYIKIFDEDEYPIWNTHIKPAMCGDHAAGNLFAWAWLTTDCTCCAFFRGMLIGGFLSGGAVGLLLWAI